MGHHGSKDSSSAAFINATKPTYSFISVGAKNQYKHPSIEALNQLNAIKTKVFRTDTHGNITLTSDGKKITISTEKK